MVLLNLFCCCKKLFAYMNTWMIGKNLMKHQYLKKKDFYSKLNMEGITDGDVRQMKRIWKDFETENNGHFHDLHVQSNTSLLSDVFENLWNISNKIYNLDRACFLTAPGIG